MRVGVLALQGAFREHRRILTECGMDSLEVRKPEELTLVDGLIIPGGESTTIGKLMVQFGLDQAIREAAAQGMPIFGTCAGMIMMAHGIQGRNQFSLGLLDVDVARNGFGRQVDSFEADLEIAGLAGGPYHAVFIRAPYVTAARPGVEVLATFEDKIVMVRQGNFLGAAFHPELTDDPRIHLYFRQMIEKARA